jgi:hypothetical protein
MIDDGAMVLGAMVDGGAVVEGEKLDGGAERRGWVSFRSGVIICPTA